VTPARVVRPWLVWLVVVLAASATIGCQGAPTSPSEYAPFSQTDLVVGDGAEAVSGSVLTVNYTGWFYDATKTDGKGVVFDTSTGNAPFTFTLGAGTVITGWDQGVVGMKVGGLRRLVIPPSLAYGTARSGVIPPDATLVFEIALLGVE
jgi:FKBP-type peptidyl-prolyl cis-trans isomerase FkpA